jgi:uncharacterized protein (DUF1810 family)
VEDRFNLERFVEAQRDKIGSVLAELKHGRKSGHWMWFVFPQLKGLGKSSTAEYYAISSRAEAESYLLHPILAPRLIECTNLVNQLKDRSTQEIFGEIDSMKFRSSMTLFATVDQNGSGFATALDKYSGGQPDPLTLGLLQNL